MTKNDYTRSAPYRSKSDMTQDQQNRRDREGFWLLPNLIDEFGGNPFTLENFRDSFTDLTENGTGSEATSREINTVAALNNLVTNGYIELNEDEDEYQILEETLACELQ